MIRVPKFFNTAGPIQPDIHYNIDPLTRIDLEELESLIYQRKYFVLHAPRQTGKTSCLLALRDYLNARGEFYAVYVNVEAGPSIPESERRSEPACDRKFGRTDAFGDSKRYAAGVGA